MRSKVYVIGIIGVVLLLALGFQILPSPWQGGASGWFSALWYLIALAAGLGYWYKFDLAKAREEKQRMLAKARKKLRTPTEKTRVRRQRAY